jgi:enoyl-CoA hydratase/carnithine racemase
VNNDVLSERRGAVLWLVINREERRNAITLDVMEGDITGPDSRGD